MNNNADGPSNVGVIIIGDSGLSVDLGFVPGGSVFFNDWDTVDLQRDSTELIVVDKNSDRTIKHVRRAFVEGIKSVTIVWNAELSKPYSFAMVSLSREMKPNSFRIVGSTAHLEIVSEPVLISGVQVKPEDMRNRLIEEFRKPSNISVGELNLLMQDHADLLTNLEELALSDSGLKLEVEVLRNKVKQLPALHDKLRELQSENLRLRKRNDALARKTFNKLTKRIHGQTADKNAATDESSR
ncbi:hypothetical protein [Corynebacterium ammoniagenes]|uniref:Uncharacterized protein n=1 Tax=Corynebacterium ammoniagenes DSM 20306 TaxID=649754 RepID=A0ABN0ABZ5_CORAM|nr:hypothetical protein [Corynebacterium ammoniagenes]AQS73280.1 hypothetical protein CA40472_04700 [Corynebacterium ammoniagenes]EFG80254.1 hypothetical protein HMPREF0281_02347 [Corynebacterium ammoniagenes DSM 20306]